MKKELKVGLFAVVIIALAVWGFNYLKGKDLLNSQRDFYGVYDYVDGLEAGQKIVINGFKVGRVNDIYFHPDGSGRILVHLVITNKQIAIPKGTEARIVGDGLLGTKMVDFRLGEGPGAQQEGDTLKTGIEGSLTEEVNRQVLPIKQKAEKMLSSIDSVMVYIQNILNKDTRDNVTGVFENLNSTFEKLDNVATSLDKVIAGNENRLDRLVGNLDSITTVIRNNGEQIDQTIRGLAAMGEAMEESDLPGMMKKVSHIVASADSIMTKLNSRSGTAGKLINDEDLYDNLAGASKELEELLRDLKLNPERYVHLSVFGRKKKPYIASDNE